MNVACVFAVGCYKFGELLAREYQNVAAKSCSRGSIELSKIYRFFFIYMYSYAYIQKMVCVDGAPVEEFNLHFCTFAMLIEVISDVCSLIVGLYINDFDAAASSLYAFI